MKPCVPLSTKNAVIFFLGPFSVFSSPVAIKTITKSACSAPEIKCLVPFTIQSVPSLLAKHFIPLTSEPASGSVIAKASIFSPRTAGNK